MAIDTENKRRSVIANLPVPDGTIAQADRQQVTWLYSGILVDALQQATGLVTATFTVTQPSATFTVTST